MWLVIIIVCIVFGFVCQPVDRMIKKNVSSKWLAIILQFVANLVILMALYGIAALFGFNIWK
jgi:predicted Na+-dependent transporter